ncbi:hypothetical protein [Acinetobacter bereziniae]|uniref:hypothetical protein n=1 Tax=Acinetobacter bereziniae TaxID=106648 RepID=UPI001D192130|nr:hypothetical protein [Acinetobacter bereziniae]MDA3439637.1 hypothetical protein [Acinetobacter bereziniae]
MQDKIQLSNNVNAIPENSMLGLVIRNIDPDRNQRHTGFIYLKNELPKLAHFGWKDHFIYQDYKPDYAFSWLNFLPERTALPIIAELELLAKQNPFFAPYGIVNKGGTKFENGALIKNPMIEGDSLTCSVFVLCLLEQFGFYIINRESWEITNEDTIWQNNILNKLEGALSPEYMKIQRENIGLVKRFRPEQIVGACCIFEFEPVEYNDACEAAKIILQRLDSLQC